VTKDIIVAVSGRSSRGEQPTANDIVILIGSMDSILLSHFKLRRDICHVRVVHFRASLSVFFSPPFLSVSLSLANLSML
jgi:hypothetical protein